jgi:hypothetical protein
MRVQAGRQEALVMRFVMRRPDAKLLINIFFKKILKVLQRAPLKNTSELKQRSKQ